MFSENAHQVFLQKHLMDVAVSPFSFTFNLRKELETFLTSPVLCSKQMFSFLARVLVGEKFGSIDHPGRSDGPSQK